MIESEYSTRLSPIEEGLRQAYIHKMQAIKNAGVNPVESVLNGIQSRYENERQPYIEQQNELDAWRESAIAGLNAEFGY